MSLAANFSLGFTYLSPVVGDYTLFAIALATGGPPMIWWLVIVGIGQFLVALVFGEVVSQFPVAGGVYPWARRLWGRRWAWMTGWVYLIALLDTIASVVYGAGPYLALLLEFTPGTGSTVICALIMLAVALGLNMLGTKSSPPPPRSASSPSSSARSPSVAGCCSPSATTNLSVPSSTPKASPGTAAATSRAFLAAAIIGVYQYYGFEACGDVAEEVPDPTRVIPRAMRMTIYVGGAAAILVCLSLLLAVPDFGAVISGEDPDPVISVLNSAFGDDRHQVRAGRRDDLVPVLHAEPDGRGQPADVLLRARRHDLRLPPAAALRPASATCRRTRW